MKNRRFTEIDLTRMNLRYTFDCDSSLSRIFKTIEILKNDISFLKEKTSQINNKLEKENSRLFKNKNLINKLETEYKYNQKLLTTFSEELLKDKNHLNNVLEIHNILCKSLNEIKSIFTQIGFNIYNDYYTENKKYNLCKKNQSNIHYSNPYFDNNDFIIINKQEYNSKSISEMIEYNELSPIKLTKEDLLNIKENVELGKDFNNTELINKKDYHSLLITLNNNNKYIFTTEGDFIIQNRDTFMYELLNTIFYKYCN